MPPHEPEKPTGADERESVWDYPRPPRLERVNDRLIVSFGGQTIAETESGYRVLETSHPPTYYFPANHVRMDLLNPEKHQSLCEFKGQASYWSIESGGTLYRNIAWSYANPFQNFSEIKDHLSFYANNPAKCWVGDEQVVAQDGDFYGGWITSRVKGPFKGGPGTRSW